MRCIAIGCYVLVGAMIFGAAQAQQRAVDRNLITAGFVMRPADTPGKMKRLQALTPYKFAARTKDGVRYYIYPDSDRLQMRVRRLPASLRYLSQHARAAASAAGHAGVQK